MRRFAIAALVTLAVNSPSTLLAQQASSGMQGRVVDESGLALPGVTIVVTHEQRRMFLAVHPGLARREQRLQGTIGNRTSYSAAASRCRGPADWSSAVFTGI
jgi:hypothetical protein